MQIRDDESSWIKSNVIGPKSVGESCGTRFAARFTCDGA